MKMNTFLSSGIRSESVLSTSCLYIYENNSQLRVKKKIYFASASVMSTHQPSSVCPYRWTCMFNSTHCRQMMECQRGLRQTNTVMAYVSFGWPMWQQYVHSNKILLLTGLVVLPLLLLVNTRIAGWDEKTTKSQGLCHLFFQNVSHALDRQSFLCAPTPMVGLWVTLIHGPCCIVSYFSPQSPVRAIQQLSSA